MVRMTPLDFRAALKELGVTQRWFAERVGVNFVTVNRWAKGKLPVPEYAGTIVNLLKEQIK